MAETHVFDTRNTFPTTGTIKRRKRARPRVNPRSAEEQAKLFVEQLRKKEEKKRKKQEQRRALTELVELKKQFAEFRAKAKPSFPEPPKYQKGMKQEFYSTREWRSVRWQVISKSNGKCSVCGRTAKDDGVIIHVDHIKPRSKFPELELEITNLQLLCADCNLGKSNKTQTF